MTLKTLHDDHTARFASRTRRSQQQPVPAMEQSGKANGAAIARPFIADHTWEK
jgi:hypothetical protein